MLTVVLNPYMRKECALRELLWSYEFVDQRIAELQDFFDDFWIPDEPKAAPKKRPVGPTSSFIGLTNRSHSPPEDKPMRQVRCPRGCLNSR